MKVAICLSCHMRTYDRTKDNLFKNVISPFIAKGHTVDIFVNTYNTISNLNKAWWMTDEIWCTYEPIAKKKVIDKVIKETYKPVSFNINKQIIPEGMPNMDNWHVLQAYNSSLGAVNLAIEHDKYDVLLLTRPDINYISPINVSEFVDIEGIMVSNHAYFNKKGSCSDIWIAGKPENLLKSLNLCELSNWEKYVNSHKVKHFEDNYNEYIHAINLPVSVCSVEWTVERIATTPFVPGVYNKYHYHINHTDIPEKVNDIRTEIYKKCLSLAPKDMLQEVDKAFKENKIGHLRAWIQAWS